MSLVPWMEMGWNVVNVEYRLAGVALAPAAVEDAMCALRFVVERAKDMGVDTDRIVVSGESAGGHLALAVGMIPESAGFTRLCTGVRSAAWTRPSRGSRPSSIGTVLRMSVSCCLDQIGDLRGSMVRIAARSRRGCAQRVAAHVRS